MEWFSRKQLLFAVSIAVVLGLVSALWDDIDPIWRGVLVGVLALSGLLAFSARSAPTQSVDDPLSRILERVLADETRRPWSPARLPWVPTGATRKPVLLVAAADYHLAEIVPLARELDKRNVESRVAVGESPWERTKRGLAWYPDLEVFALPDPESVRKEILAVVTMKDTGSMTDWVTQVRSLGIPIFGKVEGAQDFWDADTPEVRRPYRNLDLVLCQGQFDADALADQKTAIVGSSRLERLWWAPPASPREPLALINLNFVYGVRNSDRRIWLETAVAGCEAAEIPFVISVHPAEKTPADDKRMTTLSASALLPYASVLISRFSTVPLEAMARGVPFIYHNPHGERVRTFSEPDGCFGVSTSAKDLRAVILSSDAPGEAVRDRTKYWFERFVSLDPINDSASRAATALHELGPSV